MDEKLLFAVLWLIFIKHIHDIWNLLYPANVSRWILDNINVTYLSLLINCFVWVCDKFHNFFYDLISFMIIYGWKRIVNFHKNGRIPLCAA